MGYLFFLNAYFVQHYETLSKEQKCHRKNTKEMEQIR